MLDVASRWLGTPRARLLTRDPLGVPTAYLDLLTPLNSDGNLTVVDSRRTKLLCLSSSNAAVEVLDLLLDRPTEDHAYQGATSWDEFHRAKYVPATEPSLRAPGATMAGASMESFVTGPYDAVVRCPGLITAVTLEHTSERHHRRNMARARR